MIERAMTWKDLFAAIPEDQMDSPVIVFDEESLVFWNPPSLHILTVAEAVEANEERFPDPAVVGKTGTKLEVTLKRNVDLTADKVILQIDR